MSADIASTFYLVGYANAVSQSMSENQVDTLVLTPEDYISILEDRSKNNPSLASALRKILSGSSSGKYWKTVLSPNIGEPWVAPVAMGVNDAVMVTKTLNALGISGITTYIKTTPAGTYIIIKGYAAYRSAALNGTRYLAANPKMVQLGLGMKGMAGVVKGGFILSVVVASGIEIAEFIFNDEKTMYDLIGGIGVEAAKAGLASMAAYAFGAGVGLVTTVAIAPLVGVVAVTFIVGYALNKIDGHHKIKQRVIDALKAIPSTATEGIYVINTTSQSFQKKINSDLQAKYQELMDWLCPICRRY
ncbi:hypothetical protein [Acidovorax sp. LjRoot117]|uniref:hypothetical protein n=1 Tax=Acidovorax sp. LjRoot117 TaxID=3342255 RepID=UPI003ECC4820